jgi:hypothetical protein
MLRDLPAVYQGLFGVPANKVVAAQLKGRPAIRVLDEGPGAIYAVPAPEEVTEKQAVRPFGIRSRVKLVVPPHVSERVARQMSVFTIHPNPRVQWKPEKGFLFKISPALKRELLKDLTWLGVTSDSLLPSIDSTAARISSALKWGRPF